MPPKMSGDFCSAINCSNRRTKPECKGLSFIRFPGKDEKRCRKWIQNMRRADLVGISMEKAVRNRYVLCANHFESRQFNIPHERKRLVYNAVPTLFEFDSPNPTTKVNRRGKKKLLEKSCDDAEPPNKVCLPSDEPFDMSCTEIITNDDDAAGDVFDNDSKKTRPAKGMHCSALKVNGSNSRQQTPLFSYVTFLKDEERIKKLEERVEYLEDILKQVSSINTTVLDLYFEDKNNKKAVEQFKKLTSLLLLIKNEFTVNQEAFLPRGQDAAGQGPIELDVPAEEESEEDFEDTFHEAMEKDDGEDLVSVKIKEERSTNPLRESTNDKDTSTADLEEQTITQDKVENSTSPIKFTELTSSRKSRKVLGKKRVIKEKEEKKKSIKANDCCICEKCGKVYKNKQVLAQHLRQHKQRELNQSQSCQYCGKKFVLKDRLRLHLRSHTLEKKLRCTICSRLFLRKLGLLYHMSTHSGEKPYTCTICGKSFSLPQNLKRHQRLHTGLKPYECKICLKRFSQSGNLKSHVKWHNKVKNTSKLFTCNFCDETFTTAQKLYYHRANAHLVKNQYHCSVCNKSFNYLANKRRHMLIHTGKLPFQCTVCKRSFRTKENLENHSWTHRSDKRYHCEFCGKGYSDRRNLRSHLKTHANTCDAAFASAASQIEIVSQNLVVCTDAQNQNCL